MNRIDPTLSEETATPVNQPAPELPTRPPFVPMARHRAAGYFAASAMLALTQGLAQGFISANLPQIGGELGATTNQSLWLMAAYMAPRASLPLLLIKIRTQYGLRAFAEVGIVLYVLVAAASFLIDDLQSAVVVQFVSGCVSAPLSTLAFLYMLEPLPPEKKLNVGLAGALTFITLGSPLARALSPALLGDAGWAPVHTLGLGMALISLCLVFLMPLSPQPRARVIAVLDIVSYALIAIAFGGLTIAFLMGATLHWTQAPWLGELMAIALAAGAMAVAIELNRKAPLLDIRWLASPAIMHLTGALLLFRIILSEQTSGAPGLFRALGLGSAQIAPLFWIIVAASLIGGLVVGLLLKPGKEPAFHIAALILIALGGFMDGHATLLTRPAQMYVSQAMIAFASALFLPPAMLSGMMRALAKGPTYILSFIIVFLSTQSIGGVMGSGLFNSFITQRQALHMHDLGDQLTRTDPIVAQRIGAAAQGLAPTLSDPAQRTAQAVSGIATDAATQATVMAYNDAFLLLSLIAAVALALLLTHLCVASWLTKRSCPAAQPV